MKTKGITRVVLIVVTLVAGLLFGVAGPGDARTGHDSKRLTEGHFRARIVDDLDLGCDGTHCKWAGMVRIVNLRAPGTPRVRICVGIDVWTDSANLTDQRTSPDGQATAWLAGGRHTVTGFRVPYRKHHSRATHVKVATVHRYGTNC